MDFLITFFTALLIVFPVLLFGGALVILILFGIVRLVADTSVNPYLANALRSTGLGERSIKILGLSSQWMIAASLCAILVAGYYGAMHLICASPAGPLHYCISRIDRDYR